MNTRCRILYVSPNEADARLVIDALRHERGITVEHAAAGIPVLDQLNSRTERDRANLIVLGSQLPNSAALNLLKGLKADAELRTIPVLVVMAEAPSGAVDTLYDAGAACVVRRPDNADDLIGTIDATKRFWVDRAILPFCGTEW